MNRLLSSHITSVVPAQDKVIVSTLEGDVVEVEVSPFTKKYHVNRNNTIT